MRERDGTALPRLWTRHTLVALATVVGSLIGAPVWAEPGSDRAHVGRHLSGHVGSHLSARDSEQPGVDGEGDKDFAKKLAAARSMLEAATTRARRAGSAYAAATGKLPGTRDRLAVARGKVAAAEVAANRARRDAARAKRDLRIAQQAYRAAEDQVTAARERVGEYSAAAYKGHGLVVLGSVLDADSPSELAERMAFVDHVARAHQAALRKLITLRHEVKQKQNDAQLAARKANRIVHAADDALGAAERARGVAAGAATDVKNLVSVRREALQTAQAEREASLKRYQELEDESERIGSQVRDIASRDSTASPRDGQGSDGYFMMPVQGYQSSGFGSRYDPYYKVWQLHAGLDIAAPGGAPVRAAESGRVFRAGVNGGYGNYTCVYHGRRRGQGVATCYAHQSSISVSTGEQVQRGQMIGRVGSTGASTGDHLHFEVRLDGDPVDPVPWLPTCLC